jgi:phage N-6-adenine-methyltransferase
MLCNQWQQWETPTSLFAALDAEFGFTLDVCALPENAKCAHYFTPQRDGLKQFWQGVCWCNPPYGREIGRWISKAAEATKFGATMVCLSPIRTDTGWWHDHIQGRAEVWFLRGRVKFGDAENSAPFPAAIVIFRPSGEV